MKKSILLLCTLLVLVACKSQAVSTVSETPKQELSSQVVLLVGKEEKEVEISKEDAKKLHDLFKDLVYDGDQFDEETNPKGYRLSLADSDYTLVEKKGSDVVKTVHVWKEIDHLRKENKWYFCSDTKDKIIEIIEKYV